MIIFVLGKLMTHSCIYFHIKDSIVIKTLQSGWIKLPGPGILAARGRGLFVQFGAPSKKVSSCLSILLCSGFLKFKSIMAERTPNSFTSKEISTESREIDRARVLSTGVIAAAPTLCLSNHAKYFLLETRKGDRTQRTR